MNPLWLSLVVLGVVGRDYYVDLPSISDITLETAETITLPPFPEIVVDKLNVKALTNGTYKYTTLCGIRPAELKAEVKSVTVFK